MSWIKNFLILFFAIQPLLAFADINCPPTNIITDLQFQRADGAEGIWDLFSQRFRHDNKDWQVIFTVYLPEATNNDDAIKQGDYYYHSQVAFFDHPLGRSNNNRIVCYYAQQESTYFVRAIAE